MRLFCQDNPQVYELTATVVDLRPGAVLVDRSPFFPGGGGQLADRGVVTCGTREAAVRAIEPEERGTWLVLADTAHASTSSTTGTDSAALWAHTGDLAAPLRVLDEVRLKVDVDFRLLMNELHTLAHVANSVVFARCGGALLTGAQLADDGTLRVDFDLPDANNEQLRALEAPINEILRADVAVGSFYLPRAEAEATPGMFRSKAVTPPVQADGLVRIVEIAGIDRQACGGTHVVSTGLCRPCRVVKVESKGRHNRRMRLALG